MMKAVITKGYNERKKLFVLEDNEIKKVNFNDEGEWYFDENGITEGFEFNGRIYANWEELDCWEKVEFEIIDIEYDFYGTGYDKVICLIDNEKVDLIQSRHQNQCGYYVFDENLDDVI